MKVKVIGAGSIGNHLSHASRMLGWSVDVVDVDGSALNRMKTEIYPQRYGSWDDSINLFLSGSAPCGIYDLILIGTPPDSHIPLAMKALDEKPKAILIEKPICGPGLEGISEFYEKYLISDSKIFVGYDHVVGSASACLANIVSQNQNLKPQTLDVEFREYWDGIFKAHPWLSGPKDSYLGFSAKGGGASGEHSHAINLWQYFASLLNAGRIINVQSLMNFVDEDSLMYDSLCLLNLKTESGLVGRCIQDVVTDPPRKWARVQLSGAFYEWECGAKPGLDIIKGKISNEPPFEYPFKKTRPDDFILELTHIRDSIGSQLSSPLAIERGLDTMLVIAAAHKSALAGRSVNINYQKGYHLSALSYE
jgi:predicted dehydrogenase